MEEFLVKDKLVNIQSLAIEMYKTVNNLPGGNLYEFFVRNYHNYNLCSKSDLKGQNSISYFGSTIWNSVPVELSEPKFSNQKLNHGDQQTVLGSVLAKKT